jgi:hypothetical protein
VSVRSWATCIFDSSVGCCADCAAAMHTSTRCQAVDVLMPASTCTTGVQLVALCAPRLGVHIAHVEPLLSSGGGLARLVGRVHLDLTFCCSMQYGGCDWEFAWVVPCWLCVGCCLQ